MQNIVFALAGLSFRPASAKAAVAELEVGAEVFLERDPENQYDYNAVKVLVGEEFVGFVPKVDNQELASHLDADKPYTASVTGWAATNKPMIRVDLFETEEERDAG
jgi:hypothetical protein